MQGIVILTLLVICSVSQSTFESQQVVNNNLWNNQVNQDVHFDEKEDKHTVFQFHKWSNFLIWGILADVGILASRYGIFQKYRLDIHAIVMGLCVIPTIIADVLMILIWNPPKFYGKEELAYWHRPIGFTYLGLMVLQSIGGVVLKLSTQSKRTQRTLKIQSLFHIYLGYMMYLLGKIECGIGFYEVYTNAVDKGKWNVIGFWITYALIFFWRMLFEIFYQNGQLFNFLLRGKDIKCQPKTIQDAMFVQYVIQNDYQNIQKEYSDKMWFLFNNYIIDMTGFVHPGGQYIWEQTKGREISRFIYGGQGLEDGSAKAYKHSEQAIQLMKQHTIGKLEGSIQVGTWKLNTNTQLCDSVHYFGFVNKDIKISQQTNQFGRYYQIKALQNYLIPIRQYTSVISMAPENVKFRRELVNYIEGILRNEQLSEPHQPKYINEFPLIIKRYESKNGFSQYIHKNNETFEIQGPFGPWLPNKGRIALICGGAGVLPFLDLLDFHLKSLIQMIAAKQSGQVYKSDLHITLVLAVRNKSELIGSDIYFPLISLSKYIDPQYFKMVLKIKEYTDEYDCVDERFNGQFFQKHLGLLSRYDDFFICGPPSMNKSIPVVLQQLGVQKQQIHFV